MWPLVILKWLITFIEWLFITSLKTCPMHGKNSIDIYKHMILKKIKSNILYSRDTQFLIVIYINSVLSEIVNSVLCSILYFLIYSI